MSMTFRPAPTLWTILSKALRPLKEWDSRYPVAWLCIPRLFKLNVERNLQPLNEMRHGEQLRPLISPTRGSTIEVEKGIGGCGKEGLYYMELDLDSLCVRRYSCVRTRGERITPQTPLSGLGRSDLEENYVTSQFHSSANGDDRRAVLHMHLKS